MPFKFYIDDNLVDSPINDMSLSTKLLRDDQISGMVVTQDATLQWNKNNDPADGEISGYAYLKSVFDTGVCNEVALEIYDQVAPDDTYLKHRGVIKMISLEFAEQEVTLSTKIQDNSFYSYINNNRELKVDLRAIFTKNKLEIDPIDSYTVDLFNGVTGGFGSGVGAYFKGYLATDILEFIIAVITDNKVGFRSDYLAGLDYPIMIFKGQSLATSFTLFPTAPEPVFEISYQKIFDELNWQKNLYWYIDNTDPSAPVLRMERYEDTFGTGINFSIDEPLKIKTYVDLSQQYGKVTVGSTVTVDGQDPSYTMDESRSYYGFKIEDFFPLGQCNTSAEYRLVNEWVVSNNVIQDILVMGSTAYMDNYIMIECDAVDNVLLTANAYPYDFFGQPTPPFFYNLGLNNMEKLQRHSVKFETMFGNFLGVGGEGFKALLGDDDTQDITYMTGSINNPNFIPPGGLTVTAIYPNETTQGGYDGQGNYNNVTGVFTITVAGDWSFHHHLHFEVDGILSTSYFDVNARITLLDSLSNIKKTIFGGTLAPSNGFYQTDATLVCEAEVGDTVVFAYEIEWFPNQEGNGGDARTVTMIWDSYYEANGTPDGGVTVTSGNNTIKKLIHEMEYEITETQWRTILSNPTGVIPFTKDGVTRYGWIKEITRSDQTGANAQIKLLSSNATA